MYLSRQIIVNSKDRLQGSTDRFILNLPRDVEFIQTCLQAVEIPNVDYNISTTINLPVNDGISGIIFIEPGNYNIVEICSIIQTSLRDSSGNLDYTCIYDQTKMRVVIVNALPGNFELNLSNQKELARILGFDQTNYQGTYTYTGVRSPNVLQKNFVIQIQELGCPILGTNIQGTFYVPRTGYRSENTIYSRFIDYNQITYQDNKIISNLTVTLLYEDGTRVNMRDTDWSMLIYFY